MADEELGARVARLESMLVVPDLWPRLLPMPDDRRRG
jgi:hypothetical protein